ncbi:hypothetical protein Taro_022818 [Colocasia esculenta]|uniref:Enolpyruvate transferase domain-containing protein n=1 Tax=Colocasia esculenta TaxID=4460 RepID=A0A843V2X7_COLES|nr:hypothetical protein [Colocasia esculenta]
MAQERTWLTNGLESSPFKSIKEADILSRHPPCPRSSKGNSGSQVPHGVSPHYSPTCCRNLHMALWLRPPLTHSLLTRNRRRPPIPPPPLLSISCFSSSSALHLRETPTAPTITHQTLVISEGRHLSGHVRVSSSKNAALAVLAGSLCCSAGASIVCGVPAGLFDVQAMFAILRSLGAWVEVTTRLADGGDEGQVVVEAGEVATWGCSAQVPLLSWNGEGAKVSQVMTLHPTTGLDWSDERPEVIAMECPQYPRVSLVNAKLRVECRDRLTAILTNMADGVMDREGKYKIEVDGEHDDEIWESVLVSSPKSVCATPLTDQDRSCVVLSHANGVVSNKRIANNLGFRRVAAMDGCSEITRET